MTIRHKLCVRMDEEIMIYDYDGLQPKMTQTKTAVKQNFNNKDVQTTKNITIKQH